MGLVHKMCGLIFIGNSQTEKRTKLIFVDNFFHWNYANDEFGKLEIMQNKNT